MSSISDGEFIDRPGAAGILLRFKNLTHKIVPIGLRRAYWRLAEWAEEQKTSLHLARLRRLLLSMPPRTSGTQKLLHYSVRFNDGANFFSNYRDIFVKRIYHFETQRPDPLVLDCGSNIGGAILYFKHLYPRARIIAFEPDPAIFPYLQENIARNALSDVRLVQAALAREAGTRTFYSDGSSGSCLAENVPTDIREGLTKYEIPCVRLRDFLTEPVDFLKMNIESAEWEVLADSEDQLRMVREIVIEYHHLPGLPRTLHKILDLLHRQGFDYLVNDFDNRWNSAVQPPFHLEEDTRYFLLVYGKRIDQCAPKG